MLKRILIAVTLAAMFAPAGQALAYDGLIRGGARYDRADRYAMAMARTRPWHADYYNSITGYPLPVVVPPTANMETRWGWGVSQSTMTPIYHQFARPYPGVMEGGPMGGFRPTPQWPSHTDQFGTYYIRGPW